MSKAHLPPVPPSSRSDKGPGGPTDAGQERDKASAPGEKNLAEQGRQANIRQNTTNPGYQQDR